MVRHLLYTSLFLFFASQISAQLSGSYLVDPNGSGDYTTLSAAAEDLNLQGMGGNVTLQLAPALYQEQVLFAIPDQNPNQMLTIESQTGDEADVVFRFEEAVEDTNYQLAFEEIKALTIRNISINTSELENGTGIRFFGESSNITIDNLHHDGNRNDEGIIGYYILGFFDEIFPVTDVTVINSYFHEASPSISFGNSIFGEPENGLSTNFHFSNNTFFDADGITARFCENILIENNTAYGDEYLVNPITLEWCSGGVTVIKNKFWKSSFDALSLSSCSGTSENPLIVANNFVSGKGILLTLTSNTHTNIIFNSFYSDDDDDYQHLAATYNNSNCRIENNIFYENDPEGTLFSLAFEDEAVFDHNCLYSNGTYGYNYGNNGLESYSYSEYKSNTGRESNGISVQPIFAIPGEDLHTSNQALNTGFPFAEVPTDIDGETRSATNPSIGADEIDGVIITNDLTIDTVTTSGDMDAGEELTVTWSGENTGGVTFQSPWTDRVFLSSDTTLDNSDIEVSTYEVASDLNPGESYERQIITNIPLSVIGTKYAIVKINSEADIVEESDNNTAVSAPIFITPPPLPNLVVSDINLPENVFSGTQLQIEFTITNEGEAPASGNWTDIIWQEDYILGFNDTREHYHQTNSPFSSSANPIGLMPGESYNATVTVETPYIYSGYSYIRIESDGYDDIIEELDANNNFEDALIDSVFINQSPLADLIIEDIQVPSESFAGEEITISYTVKNNGTETTSPVELPYNFYFGWTWAPLFADWVDYTYLSDSTLSFSADQYEDVESHDGNIEVDSTYVVHQTITLPDCDYGPYFIIAYADRWNHVAELDEDNNSAISDTINIIPLPGPDLIADSADPIGGMVSNSSHTLSYQIENQGADTAFGSWHDRVFISDSSTFQYNISEMVADTIRTGDLAPDEVADYEIELNIPPEVYGDKYLFLWVDAINDACEQPFDNNNIFQIPTEIEQSPAADLQVSFIPPSGTVVAGDDLNLSVLTTNIGDADPNNSTWIDKIFLIDEESNDLVIYQEEYPHDGGLMVDADYSFPNPFTLPLDIDPGFYSIGAETDTDTEVWENESEDNNYVMSEPFQITIDSSRTPDLMPASLGGQDWNTGQAYSVAVAVTNSEAPTGINTWVDELILADTLGQEIASATAIFSGNLETNDAYTATFELEIPVGAPSSAVFIARIDTLNLIFEYQKTNNTRAFPIEINDGPTPDLAPTTLEVPSEVYAGQELFFTVFRQNLGEIALENSNWIERVLLSQDNQPDPSDITLKSYTFLSETIQAETGVSFTDSVQVPLTVAGNYFVIYIMDANDQVAEGSLEANNYVVSNNAVAIPTPAPVDFSTDFNSINIVDGNPESLQYSLTNTSSNTFKGKFYNTWYLSSDSAYSVDDRVLGRDIVSDFNIYGSQIQIDPGETIDEYAGFIYQPVLEGDYYIIQKIDAFLNVYETDEENNTVIFGPFHVDNIPEIFPDLTYEKQFGRNSWGLLEDNAVFLGGMYPVWIPPSYDSGFDPSPDRHDYKINIPDGFGMIAHMWEDEEENEQYGISNESQPVYEIYVGEEFVPSPLNFDFRFDSPLQSDQTVIVPVADERTDYIKTFAPYIPPHFDPAATPVSNYFLRAEFKEFSVFELSPEKVGNAHNVTLRITGFDLVDTAGLDVALIQDTDTVFAYETYPQNPSELVAYIDMRGYEAGEYSLMVKKRSSGDYTIWEEPVEVFRDRGARLFTEVNAQSASRVGENIPVSVTYGNDGYSNIYDMLVIVAIFMDDSSSAGLEVDYLGSTYPGYEGNSFISTEGNPAQPIIIGVTDEAVIYGAYVPIVHARSRETYRFTVKGNNRGIITTQSTLGLVKRSPYTFSGRTADADRSRYAVLLGRAISSSPDALSELAKTNNCDQTLNADAMTERLAEQTYEVAKKARGSTSWYKDLKDNVTHFFGANTGINKRYESFKGMVDAKGDLELTANDETPFYTELTDIFDCMDPSEIDKEPIGESCESIVTWTEGNRTFTVKMDMRGTNLACPDPDDEDDPHEPKNNKKTDNTQSKDPNEIIGPRGIGPARLVANDELFEYTVYFENVADATAPAARVRIDNPLDSNMRIARLRVQSFGFADTSFQFNDLPFVQKTVNLGSDYQNNQLRIIGGTNPQTGKAFFEFTTIDPETQGIVTGANEGFLWPNDSTGRGEGYVSYVIEAKKDLEPGTVIKNDAAIIFDDNAIIETNTWKNTVSGGELASKVDELPEYSAQNFDLRWINETPAFGPPVSSFDIYIRDVDGKGTWKKWLGQTKSMRKQFTGIPGHTYEFYSRARSADGIESFDGSADARTTIINFQGDVDDGDPVLFPNPASDQTQMAYRSSGRGTAMEVRITDIQGKQLYVERFSSPGSGIQFLSIPIRKLSGGVYVVTLYEGDARRGTDKLVVTGYPKQ